CQPTGKSASASKLGSMASISAKPKIIASASAGVSHWDSCVRGIAIAFFTLAWKRLCRLLPRRKQEAGAAREARGRPAELFVPNPNPPLREQLREGAQPASGVGRSSRLPKVAAGAATLGFEAERRWRSRQAGIGTPQRNGEAGRPWLQRFSPR